MPQRLATVLAWSTLAVALVTGQVLGQSDSSGAEQLAQALVRHADEVRFPSDGYEVTVTVETTDGGQPVESRVYRVLAKGGQNTIVMVTKPASERGQILLMKQRDLWLFLPNVSQPVRLSLAQRLTGQVANGDIARANFTGDYRSRLIGTEESNGEAFYVLDLIAVDRGVTYQRVRYWVRKQGGGPYRAEFYSLSNRLLKTCVYENYQEIAGRMRPTRLVMTDALRKQEVSVMKYSALKSRNLPDKIFTKDYLKRLD